MSSSQADTRDYQALLAQQKVAKIEPPDHV